MRNPHVPPGFWRGVNINQNAIYIECFMDELAHAAGQDPLEFRRKLMAKPEASRRAQRGRPRRPAGASPRPPGVFRGLAQIMGYGSYVAGLSPRSRSSDDGTAEDPPHRRRDRSAATRSTRRRSSAQVAGSFVYGLSALLYGEITVKDGAIEQTNFDTYNVDAHRRDAARSRPCIMPSGGFWGGVGEPTIAVAAPAVLNAICRRPASASARLPLMNHDLKKGA